MWYESILLLTLGFIKQFTTLFHPRQIMLKIKKTLNKLIPFVARQAHHEGYQYLTVRPDFVEVLNLSILYNIKDALLIKMQVTKLIDGGLKTKRINYYFTLVKPCIF